MKVKRHWRKMGDLWKLRESMTVGEKIDFRNNLSNLWEKLIKIGRKLRKVGRKFTKN